VTYLELQRQVVDKLREIGVYYAYDDRLALFWLRQNIPRLFGQKPEIISLLDELVRIRTEGNEPFHDENGKYTNM
jgi:hypothetical protein